MTIFKLALVLTTLWASAEAQALPAVTLCNVNVAAGQPYFDKVLYPNATAPDYAVHTCRRSCPTGSLATCGADYPLFPGSKFVGLVVDGMAFQAYFKPVGLGTNRNVILSATFGSTLVIPDVPVRNALVNAGVNYIEIFAAPGVTYNDVPMGALSRTSASPSNFHQITARWAAIANFFIVNHLSPEAKVGTYGCSMGSIFSAAARVWHGLDGKIDFSALGSGLTVYDFEKMCDYENSQFATQKSSGVGGVRLAVDYVHKSTLCQAGETSSAFATSNFAYPGHKPKFDLDNILSSVGTGLVGIGTTDDTNCHQMVFEPIDSELEDVAKCSIKSVAANSKYSDDERNAANHAFAFKAAVLGAGGSGYEETLVPLEGVQTGPNPYDYTYTSDGSHCSNQVRGELCRMILAQFGITEPWRVAECDDMAL